MTFHTITCKSWTFRENIGYNVLVTAVHIGCDHQDDYDDGEHQSQALSHNKTHLTYIDFNLIYFKRCKHEYKTFRAAILVTGDKRHYKGSGDSYIHSGPKKVDHMATGKVDRKFH